MSLDGMNFDDISEIPGNSINHYINDSAIQQKIFCADCGKDFHNEESFNYGSTIYCINCLIKRMFKNIKNIENFKLLLKEYAEINIKEINYRNLNINIEIKAKRKWVNNFIKANLNFVIPEKDYKSDDYEIIFKDGMFISDMINLDFSKLNISGENTIIFIIRPLKTNDFDIIENIKLFF